MNTNANDAGDLPRYFLSAMTNVRIGASRVPRLVMDDITVFTTFSTWPEMAAFIATNLRYPQKQASKYESFGWLPFLFADSTKPIVCKNGRIWNKPGTYRLGAHEIDVTCALYLDVDNKRTDLPTATMQAVADRLVEAGLAHLLYSTYSSTALKPKFRLVVPLDGLATRHQLRVLYLWMQDHILFGQADGTIYDPSDFVFAPCFDGRIVQADGAALPIEASTDWVITAISAEDQQWLDDCAEPTCAPAEQSPEQAQATAERMRNWAVSTGCSISNPSVCDPAWLTKYAAGPASHNDEIGRVMSRIWKRSGGLLGIGEMAALYDEVDALAAGYCNDKYGHANKMDRLARIMKAIPAVPSSEQERRIEHDRLGARLRMLKERRTPPAKATPTT